jgi:hypothetical protein
VVVGHVLGDAMVEQDAAMASDVAMRS